jgi:hypothetical protein
VTLRYSGSSVKSAPSPHVPAATSRPFDIVSADGIYCGFRKD